MFLTTELSLQPQAQRFASTGPHPSPLRGTKWLNNLFPKGLREGNEIDQGVPDLGLALERPWNLTRDLAGPGTAVALVYGS